MMKEQCVKQVLALIKGEESLNVILSAVVGHSLPELVLARQSFNLTMLPYESSGRVTTWETHL